MAESGNSDDIKTLQEKLDYLKAQREKILGSLNTLGDGASQSADSLDLAMKNSEELAKSQLGGVSNHLKETVKTSRVRVSDLGRQIKTANSSSSEPLWAYSWSTRIIWASLCFALGTIIILAEAVTSPYVLPVVLLYVLGEVANELYLKSRREIYRLETEQVDSQLKSLDEGLEVAAKTSPKPAIDFSSIKQIASSVTSGLKHVANTLSSLTPVIKELSTLEDQYAKQRRTIEDVRYMLRRYKFEVDEKLASDLATYSSVSINDDIWAEELLKTVQKSKGVRDEILKLAYYDSIGRTSSTAMHWGTIRNDPETFGDFARFLVRQNLVVTPGESQDTIDTLSVLLSGLPDYSLDGARLRANAFFDDLKTFKLECINHLRHYGLTFDQREPEVIGLVPKPLNSSEWKKAVIGKIGEILGLDSDYIALLVNESLGDYEASLAAWNSIVSGAKFEGFARLLVKNGIVRSSADAEVAISRLVLVMQSTKDKFSFRDVATDLTKLEAEILRVRRSIIFCCNQYSIQVDSAAFGLDFVSESTQGVESEFVAKAAAQLQSDPTVFRLLYSTTTGSLEAGGLFAAIKRDKKLASLGDFLLEHKLLPSIPFSENLVTLLSLYRSFDLREVSSAFEYYDRLNALSRNLVIFVEENGLGSPSALAFQDIVRVCPVNAKPQFEEGVIRLLSELMTPGLGGENFSTGERIEVVTGAATLFLYVQNDPVASSLCKKVGFMKLGSRVLYEYAKLADEMGLTQIKPTIRIALKASSAPLDNDRHYESFVTELVSGVLHVKVTYLLSKQVAEIRDLLDKVEKRGFEAERIAENLRESVNDTLEKQVDNDIVSDLLLRQVLSAYVITVPSTDPVIRLVDDYLEDAAKALAVEKDDPSFRALIMIKKGMGSWTRVGMVPFGMTFERFTERYEEVADKAKETYRLKYPSSTETLTHFLVRVLPSSDAMKVVFQDPQRKLSPITTVRELIEEKMPGVDSLQVLTVTQSTGTSTVKLRTVVESVIDSNKSNIRALLGEPFAAQITGMYPWLDSILEKRTIEARLFEEFGANRLSSLSISIARLGKVDEVAVKRRLRTCIERSVPKGLSISDDDCSLLSGLVYQSLRGIGVVLTT